MNSPIWKLIRLISRTPGSGFSWSTPYPIGVDRNVLVGFDNNWDFPCMYKCIPPWRGGPMSPFLGCLPVCSSVVPNVLSLVSVAFFAPFSFPLEPNMRNWAACSWAHFPCAIAAAGALGRGCRIWVLASDGVSPRCRTSLCCASVAQSLGRCIFLGEVVSGVGSCLGFLQ